MPFDRSSIMTLKMLLRAGLTLAVLAAGAGFVDSALAQTPPAGPTVNC
jgi:hypothetical protein